MTYPTLKGNLQNAVQTTVKGKGIAKYPASLSGADGVAVTINQGAATFTLDYPGLIDFATISDPDSTYIAAHNAVLGYRRISVAAFVLAVAAAIDLEALADDIYAAGLVGDMFKATYDANNDGVVDYITNATAKAVGDEGGQINLEKAVGSTLGGNVAIDTLLQRLRFFEAGGTSRGAYLEFTECGAGASSKLLHTGNVTTAGQELLTAADAAAQRTALGLAALAQKATIDSAALVDNSILTFAKLASAAIADQSTAEAGTATDKLMTPQRTAQAIVAKSPATLSATGAQALPSGLLLKWGTVGAGASTGTVTFAAAFPNACLGVHLQVVGASATTGSRTAMLDGNPTASSFAWFLRQTAAGGTTGASTDVGFMWFAFGH